MTITSLVNGKAGDQINIWNRGLAYGDGLFETIAIVNQLAPLLEQHLQRLQQGCRRLEINCDWSALRDEIALLLNQKNTQAFSVLKIIICREQLGRGYAFQKNSPGQRILALSAAADYTIHKQQGVRVRVCQHRLPINPALAGLKHLNRLDNVLARAEWNDKTVFEGLMLDTQGRIVEATMSNLFMVGAGKLMTPSLKRCGVQGIMRDRIIEQFAADISVPVTVKDLLLSDLIAADELFICNSVIGLLPVVAVGCHLKSIGPVSTKLQQRIDQAFINHVY